MDMKPAKKQPMPTPSWMEPMLPSDGGRALEDVAFDLISNYQPDQVLVFHRASHGIEKHEALTVTGVSVASIHTMNERGEEKSVSLTQARSFSVHERTEIEIACRG